MSDSYKPMHYSASGIRLMSDMFEQQMRIAHAMGAVAMAANPMLQRAPATRLANAGGAAPQPAERPVCVRTHSMPV